MSQNQQKLTRTIGAAVLVVLGLAAYGAVAFNTLRNGRTNFEEVGYLIRSWWYTAGTVAPYTNADATWQMPLYFYLAGWWQKLVGIGHHPVRILSAALGLVGAGFLFATCRRLTGNVLASAAGVLVFLATPATAYAFSMATPAALISTLHLAAIYIVVVSLGRPRIPLTIVFALICVTIFFTRQNLFPGFIALCVLYLAAIGRQRRPHIALLIGAIVFVTGLTLLDFPGGLAAQAARLPLLAPSLSRWGVLPTDFGLIQSGTTGAATVLPEFASLQWTNLLDTLILPYAGLIVLAAAVFFVTGEALRILWIAPLYFFGLIIVHVLASASYCDGCMIGYVPYFAGVGALSAALALATLASIARQHEMKPGVIIVVGAIVGVALSALGPTLARNAAYRYFPAPQLVQPRPELELDEVDMLSRWVKETLPVREPILLIHANPALPYAMFLGGATFPVQSIDPDSTKRTIRPRVTGSAREIVQAAVEAQSLWTEETQRRWLTRDYELVLLAQANDKDQAATAATLNESFDVVATHPFRGQTLTLFRRKALQ